MNHLEINCITGYSCSLVKQNINSYWLSLCMVDGGINPPYKHAIAAYGIVMMGIPSQLPMADVNKLAMPF